MSGARRPTPDLEALRRLYVQPAPKLLRDIQSTVAELRSALSVATSDRTPTTWDGVVGPLATADDRRDLLWGRVLHFRDVEDSPKWRRIIQKAEPWMTDVDTEKLQSADLFRRLQALAGAGKLSIDRRRAVSLMVEDHEQAGAALPSTERRALARLFQRISKLSTAFSRRLLDATNSVQVAVTDERDLAGLPADVVLRARAEARRRGQAGWLFVARGGEGSTILRTATSRRLRRLLYHQIMIEASSRGPKKNDTTPVIQQLMTARQDMAHILGYRTYSHFVLARRMAKTPHQAEQLIRQVVRAARPVAIREYEALARFGATTLGLSQVQPWDLDRVADAYRAQTFGYSTDQLRKYFPLSAVLAALRKTAARVLGVQMTITPWAGYRSDLLVAMVNDARGPRGHVLLDLHTRPEKRGGAWMHNARGRRHDAHGVEPAMAFVVCNFPPVSKNGETYLTHDEVATLFHEFGHAFHHLLSDSTTPRIDGLHGVEWDAVELPSQWFERFAWEPTVWAWIAAAGAPRLPEDLRTKLLASRHYLGGMRMVRQIQFGLFDLWLYRQSAVSRTTTQRLWHSVLRRYSVVPWTKDNHFPNSFSHIFDGGYASGYYSYLWAEVLATDAFAPFAGHPERWGAMGRRFRREILAVGGRRPAAESFQAFRGRAPHIRALLREYRLGRG